MILFDLATAANMAGGLARGTAQITRVNTDSRTIQPGDLFVALRGERFDGHDYAAMALLAGAAAVMVDESAALHLTPSIVVEDTRLALGRLAACWRMQQGPTVVAITGSSGKTTVKEMLASILRHAVGEEAVLATKGNLNNDIGVPLTLLQLTGAQRYAVIETGMNHAGELDYLSRMVAPDVVLVNNAGSAHMGLLGSVTAVAQAKGELIAASPAHAVVVINADDTHAGLWRQLAGARKRIEFGRMADCQVSYTLHSESSQVCIRLPDGLLDFCLPVPGQHNVMNALAAISAAHALGIDHAGMIAGLTAFVSPAGRLVRTRLGNGVTLLDDSYNANPESMRAAIDVLVGQPGRHVLVLGDMGELGEAGASEHRAIGAYARQRGIDTLLVLGDAGPETGSGFGPAAKVYVHLDDLLKELQVHLLDNVTVLVKGSRFMRMERVVDYVKGSS